MSFSSTPVVSANHEEIGVPSGKVLVCFLAEQPSEIAIADKRIQIVCFIFIWD